MTKTKDTFILCKQFCKRLFYIYKLVWDVGKGSLILLLLLSLIEGCLPVISAIISKNILNELQIIIQSPLSGVGIEEFLKTQLFFWLIFFFVLKILSSILTRVNNTITRLAGERLIAHIKLLIMNKSKEIDLASFDSPVFFENLENANREAGIRPISILQASFSILSSTISLFSYFVVLSTALPFAAICMVIVSVPTAIINFTYRKKHYEYIKYNSKDRREMNYYSNVLVNKDLVKEIKIFSLTEYFVSKYNCVFQRYFGGLKKLILKENILHIVITIASSITSCVFFAIIAYQVVFGKIMIGDYSLLTGSLTSIASSVSAMIMLSATIYEGTLFIDNLMTFLDEKSQMKENSTEKRHVAFGQPHTIEFVNVSFKYPGSDKDVLKNINVKFEAEKLTILVGLNGAGKTTLIKLMTRLYDPTTGIILLDGYDIREYYIDELYKTFGAIFQDFGRYAVSISDNIVFGNISQGFDEIHLKNATEFAGISDYIEQLAEGNDTPLTRIFQKEGVEPSIGQWQKISIARAYYGSPDVLILDEPTAALDPRAEQEIYNQFEGLSRGKTTVFVSHRLSSATIASKIIVIDQGCVIEEGTHSELMQKKGKYYELFSIQAQRYSETTNNMNME